MVLKASTVQASPSYSTVSAVTQTDSRCRKIYYTDELITYVLPRRGTKPVINSFWGQLQQHNVGTAEACCGIPTILSPRLCPTLEAAYNTPPLSSWGITRHCCYVATKFMKVLFPAKLSCSTSDRGTVLFPYLLQRLHIAHAYRCTSEDCCPRES